jgi:transcriptional regulator with XRE-family HTH domain
MNKSGIEDLSRFIRRTMSQKQLKVRDVELQSGGTISNGYVSGVMSGSVTNLSIDKLKALARGLGIDVHEILDIICGPRERAGGNSSLDAAQWLEFLDLMQKVVAIGELQEILKEAALLSREERLTVLKFMERLNHSKNKSQAKSKQIGPHQRGRKQH